jgi:hypothetical protein
MYVDYESCWKMETFKIRRQESKSDLVFYEERKETSDPAMIGSESKRSNE